MRHHRFIVASDLAAPGPSPTPFGRDRLAKSDPLAAALVSLDHEIEIASKDSVSKSIATCIAPLWRRAIGKAANPNEVVDEFGEAHRILLDQFPINFDNPYSVTLDFSDVFSETAPGEFHVDVAALMLALRRAGRNHNT